MPNSRDFLVFEPMFAEIASLLFLVQWKSPGFQEPLLCCKLPTRACIVLWASPLGCPNSGILRFEMPQCNAMHNQSELSISHCHETSYQLKTLGALELDFSPWLFARLWFVERILHLSTLAPVVRIVSLFQLCWSIVQGAESSLLAGGLWEAGGYATMVSCVNTDFAHEFFEVRFSTLIS